ncbi:MAG: GNAT family N-acetyltransferase [Janthinobacterium lividum]
MSEFICRVAEVADAPAIVGLANQYTYQQLSATAREGGFLTGNFSVPALQAMLASVPGQVAYRQQELVGFVVNSWLAAKHYPPLVQQLLALLPELYYRQRPLADYRLFFYGPVLVQQAYRGRGLLRQLFQANQRALAGHFDVGVAFIAAENAASLHVHTQKLGLEPVGSLDFAGATYVVLAFAVD